MAENQPVETWKAEKDRLAEGSGMGGEMGGRLGSRTSKTIVETNNTPKLVRKGVMI
jgi:hypothetical protein